MMSDRLNVEYPLAPQRVIIPSPAGGTAEGWRRSRREPSGVPHAGEGLGRGLGERSEGGRGMGVMFPLPMAGLPIIYSTLCFSFSLRLCVSVVRGLK